MELTPIDSFVHMAIFLDEIIVIKTHEAFF